MTRRGAHLRLLGEPAESDDPLSGVANLFDVALVFAVALLLALFAALDAELRAREPQLRGAVPPAQVSVERFRSTDHTSAGEGVRLGTAYRLASGEVVYVPDSPAELAPSPPR